MPSVVLQPLAHAASRPSPGGASDPRRQVPSVDGRSAFQRRQIPASGNGTSSETDERMRMRTNAQAKKRDDYDVFIATVSGGDGRETPITTSPTGGDVSGEESAAGSKRAHGRERDRRKKEDKDRKKDREREREREQTGKSRRDHHHDDADGDVRKGHGHGGRRFVKNMQCLSAFDGHVCD